MVEEIPAWRASELVGRGAQLVDVRERDEVAAGTHPDALCIPFSELDRRLDRLDRSRPVALLCRSGNRSRQAGEILDQRGFRRVVNLSGGIQSLVG